MQAGWMRLGRPGSRRWWSSRLSVQYEAPARLSLTSWHIRTEPGRKIHISFDTYEASGSLPLSIEGPKGLGITCEGVRAVDTDVHVSVRVSEWVDEPKLLKLSTAWALIHLYLLDSLLVHNVSVCTVNVCVQLILWVNVWAACTSLTPFKRIRTWIAGWGRIRAEGCLPVL